MGIVARPRIAIAKPQIEAAMDQLGVRVFTKKDLGHFLADHRDQWGLPTNITLSTFLGYLLERSHLATVTIEAVPDRNAQSLTRFTWRACSPLELGSSIRGGSYLSHGTAVFVHGLNDELPRRFFVNREQTPKPSPRGKLTQEALDRTFGSRTAQRTTSLIYTDGEHEFAMLAGKQTQDAGVIATTDPYGGRVRVTNVERTLIDITVRPAYAGGVELVQEAFRGAFDRASMTRLCLLLDRIDHVYPFHQSIGYYAEKAGFSESQLERLLAQGLEFDFYLTYGMKNPRYVPRWRLFVPEHFKD